MPVAALGAALAAAPVVASVTVPAAAFGGAPAAVSAVALAAVPTAAWLLLRLPSNDYEHVLVSGTVKC